MNNNTLSEYNFALVTGASGFVGNYFLRHLMSTFPQMSVTVTARDTLSTKIVANQLECVSLDLSKPIAIQAKPDIVFHIAGEKRDESKMWDVNLEGTRKLLDWSAHNGIKRFVYLSSVGVYGAQKNAGNITEASIKAPQNTYEKSKSAAEALVKEHCENTGMEYVILQPSNVIGITGAKIYPLLGMMRMVKKGLFTYFDEGAACFNYVAVEDVVGALVAAISKQARNRTFILNSALQMKTVVDLIADAVGVARPRRALPTALGFIAGEAASTLTRLTGKALPFNRERFNELTNTTHYDGSAIAEATRFTYPLGIEAAIRQLAHHYTKEGLL